MSVIFILILLSVVIAGGFLAAFVWAVHSGQYDDTFTPSLRLLTEDRSEVRRPRGSSAPRATPPSRLLPKPGAPTSRPATKVEAQAAL